MNYNILVLKIECNSSTLNVIQVVEVSHYKLVLLLAAQHKPNNYNNPNFNYTFERKVQEWLTKLPDNNTKQFKKNSVLVCNPSVVPSIITYKTELITDTIGEDSKNDT
jgi:hypothetical protein